MQTLGLFLQHQKYDSHFVMKIASPSDKVSIERSENSAFDRAFVGGANYFGPEVRTECATLGLFLQHQIVYTLK